MKCELSVHDDGRLLTLDYQGLLAYHDGNAVAGATIGFRVVQAAADVFKSYGVDLERNSIKVISGHPGPGYQDAFEYILHCVSRQRFTVDRNLPEARYSPYHEYAFQFLFVETTLAKKAIITLREDIILPRFFEVLRDLKIHENDSRLNQELDNLKQEVARKALVTNLHRLFDTRVIPIATN